MVDDFSVREDESALMSEGHLIGVVGVVEAAIAELFKGARHRILRNYMDSKAALKAVSKLLEKANECTVMINLLMLLFALKMSYSFCLAVIPWICIWSYPALLAFISAHC